ncbi:probable cytochrome P450 305a1 [Tenebrio molitor]|uniref:probable cytochrome P450 305a1 n=1 Tax=Tenebrio molitor TaxID=7067 RepID=UPI003624A96E
MLFILITAVSIITVIVTYLVSQIRKPKNLPPGPLWWPFVGNLPELKKLSKSLGGQHLALAQLAKTYKTNILGLKLGNEYVVTVFSYRIVREVFLREEFEGRPTNFFTKLRCMGKIQGVTATDGELWRIQKNLINRHLHNLGLGKTPMEEMIRDEVVEMLSALRDDGSNVKVDKFIAPGVLNVLWTLTTGARISKNQLDELLDLFAARSKAFDLTGGTLALYPWLRFVAPEWCGFNLIQEINNKLKKLFEKIIEEHRETWHEGRNDDLIYRYISESKAPNKNSAVFNDDQLIMLCLDLFIGGNNNTSGTLDFGFLLMILHPDVQQKVQAQLDTTFSKNHILEYSDRDKLPYVEAVILEIMRFRHVAPLAGPRRVTKDTYLDGYFLPKDTTILLSLHSINNNAEYWKDPENFMPERFLDENGLLLPHEKLLSFGSGRRRCVGEVLAKTCIFFFFVEILKNFYVSVTPGSKLPSSKPVPGMILSTEPYWATFTERS